MSVTKPLIFTNVGIANADGTGVTFYPLNVSESATVTVTPTTDMLENGQTLPAFFDVEVQVVSFNANIYSDTRVYSNSTVTPSQARMILSGATGAQTLNIGPTYITATRVYDGNRTGIQLTATQRGVSDVVLVNPT